MSTRSSLRYWGPAAMLLLLTACNRPDLVDPTATPSPRPLSLEEIETAVVATLVAEGEMTPSVRSSDTPVPDQPSPTPSDTPTGPTETPTEVRSCVVISNALNLRYGPGLVYAPPLQTLTSGTVLLPFAKNDDGSWLEVQLQGESTTGWVSAGGQFVSCNFDPSGLPQGQIPPTPTPTKTLTPTPTLTPSPTDKPTTAPTACPDFKTASLSANVGKNNVVTLTWNSTGGCGSVSGTITAIYSDQRSPYANQSVKGTSGKWTHTPPGRSDGSYSIVFTLKLEDSAGHSITSETKVTVRW